MRSRQLRTGVSMGPLGRATGEMPRARCAESLGPKFVRVSRAMTALVTTFLLLLPGCVTNDAVSKFAGQSSQALAQGQPIFEDLQASCIRQHLAEQAIPEDVNKLFDTTDVKIAAADPACLDYAAVQPGLLAALKVLTDYFNALSQLASTGTASSGKNSASDTSTAKSTNLTTKTTNFTAEVLSALTNLSAFLGQVATTAYREKELARDIRARDNDISIVTNALKQIVVERYENHQLVSEENSIQRADLDLLGKTSDPAIRALYRNQWRDAIAIITAKKSTADAFVKSLENIRDGHHALATHAGSLRAKDLPALIQPYTDSLSKLVPSLQKVL